MTDYLLRRVAEREQLAASPTGTVVRTGRDNLWLVDHGPNGEWVGPRTRIYLLSPDTARVFYPANFDLSLPVAVWSPAAEAHEWLADAAAERSDPGPDPAWQRLIHDLET